MHNDPIEDKNELFIQEAYEIFNSLADTVYHMRESGLNYSDDMRQDLIKLDELWTSIMESEVEDEQEES